MLDVSVPPAFLDYVRMPYRVRPELAEGLPPGLACLAPAGGVDEPGPMLLWPVAGGPLLSEGTRPARFDLAGRPLAGALLTEGASAAVRTTTGRSWQAAEPLTGPGGEGLGTVWRDDAGGVLLPFDPGEVMRTLWSERYVTAGERTPAARVTAAARRGYYLARPLLPRRLQLRLRRAYSKIQARSAFPRWPLEEGLHQLYDWLLGVVAGVAGRPVPWIAPWPDGAEWALVLTHDVETADGARDIALLRDPERALGYRSSWNFVPERYPEQNDLMRELRDEGCEVGVHGLRHDGRDLGSERLLAQRRPRMRAYAQAWGAVGFRSPATQRVWDWMPTLGFDYDSSYTDTDPYEPQGGGCCTWWPFLNGGMVELPITLPQDHTVFRILGVPGEDLWLDKARALRERGGMALVLTHPDYARDPKLDAAYKALLGSFAEDPTCWRALPCEVAQWWRRRAATTLVEDAGTWVLRGPAAGDGRVRWAEPAGRDDAAVPPAARRRPHVLLVVESLPLAVDIRVRKQVRDLLGGGYDVTAVCPASPRNAEFAGLPGLTLREYPPPPDPAGPAGYVREYGVSFARAVAAAAAVRARRRIDVVQFCQPPDIYFPLAWVLRAAGAKVVIDQRDLMPELFEARYGDGHTAILRGLRFLERRSMRAAHHALSVNTWTRDRLVGAGMAPAGVTMLYNGPVLARLARARPDPELVADGRALCVWVGSMARQDRVELVVDVAEHVVRRLGRRDLRFVLLGDGESRQELLELTAERGLEGWVELPGFVPEERVFSYLATADIGVDSSLQAEVTPVKVLEYMAAGLPVVAFDLPETRAAAAAAGLLVPPGDVEALASAVADLLDDPSRRIMLGAAGQRRVHEEFAWERQAEAYLAVMDGLVDRR